MLVFLVIIRQLKDKETWNAFFANMFWFCSTNHRNTEDCGVFGVEISIVIYFLSDNNKYIWKINKETSKKTSSLTMKQVFLLIFKHFTFNLSPCRNCIPKVSSSIILQKKIHVSLKRHLKKESFPHWKHFFAVYLFAYFWRKL